MSTLPTRSERSLDLEVQEVDGLYVVESQSRDKPYVVDLNGEDSSCTCPDHEYRNVICKHIRAAAIKEERGEA